MGLAFTQDAGLLISDTKFDLVENPGGFLSRALHLWDGAGAFGQLQNQAYGYLWPMGPFFLLGSAMDLPGWVVQRLWMGVVMCVAFVGTARVTRALGVRSDLACFVAAFAFALSPRMLSTLGPISIEAWPGALAPWVLLPLVRGATHGSARRSAALSGLAVAMVGGVNAAATFAVLPMGVIWLLTRTPGPRRRALMLWWPIFTALGTLWWLVPLFLLGAYSPPFLDYIETATITAFPTTLFDAARGTSNWVPYIDSTSRAGNDLLTSFYLVLNSGVVLLFGFAGLMSRRNPHRQFLGLSLVVGLVMVTAGHIGSVSGWFADDLNAALDGVLAPLRNVHKFDPVVRLPLALGIGFAVQQLMSTASVRSPGPAAVGRAVALSRRLNQWSAVGLVMVAVVGASLPIFTGRIAPSGALVAVPDYWEDAADWMEQQGEGGTALLLPGSGFARYGWGEPKDEPLQYMTEARWAVRNAIPLAPGGNIRMLDAVEARLSEGRPSSGLATFLRRAGVRHLVLRNDLSPSNDVPDPVMVHQTLDGSPGLGRVATFGPLVGGEAHLTESGRRIVINAGRQARYPAIEVYQVLGGTQRAVAATGLPTVVGGPEDLLDLTDLGLIDDAPVQLAVDAGEEAAPPSGIILTDGLRERERFFGRVHDGASATTTPGDVRRSGNPVSDYRLTEQDERWRTTVRLDGARALSASSSLSDADTVGGTEPGRLPYAAVDGDPDTEWVSGRGKSGATWWQVDLESAETVSEVSLTGGGQAWERQRVRVRTSGQVTQVVDLGPGTTRTVQLDPSETDWVRVESADATGMQLSLAEVAIAGLDVRRSLVLPRLPEAWGTPASIVLRPARDARTGCAVVGESVRCAADRARAGEEETGMDRILTLPRATAAEVSMRVRPRAGLALEELLQEDLLANVGASSVDVADVRASALSAVDGDDGTTWLAEDSEVRPSLSLRWLKKQRIQGIVVTTDRDTAARRPTEVTLVSAEGRREVPLDAGGRAAFAPLRTSRVEVQVTEAEEVDSIDFQGSGSEVPVGISELRLIGAPGLPLSLSRQTRDFGCGSGPTLRVGDVPYLTAVAAAPADLAQGASLEARICGSSSLRLPSGETRIEVDDAEAFSVDSAVLTTDEVGPAFKTLPAAILQEGASERTLAPAAGAEVVVLRENTNAGWGATQNGAALKAVVVDGWQQGWLTDGSDATVLVDFRPDLTYRMGLTGGLLCWLLLVTGVLLPPRRSELADEALGARQVAWPLWLAASGVGAGLLAGWIGLCLVIVAGIAFRAVDRRHGEVAQWVAAGCVLVSALGYVLQPWGSADGWAGTNQWPHYLVLVSLAGVLASPLSGEALRGRRRSPSRRFLKRRAGISTSR